MRLSIRFCLISHSQRLRFIEGLFKLSLKLNFMDEKIESLKRWIQGSAADLFQEPCISDSIDVHDREDLGRHLIASKTIENRKVIIRIPRTCMLNYITILQHLAYWNPEVCFYLKGKGISPVSAQSEEVIPSEKGDNEDTFRNMYKGLKLSKILSLTSTQLISWYLIMIIRRKEGSFWKHFVKVLPSLGELQTLPIVWSLDQLGSEYTKLLPNGLFQRVEKQKKSFLKDYNRVCEFTDSLDECMKVDSESFLWGWLVCNTRCIYLNLPDFLNQDSKEKFTLVPYVDFLNHTLEEHCTISVNRKFFSVSTAKSKYGPNEQLYFSYGPHTDDRLLCDYGFMLPLGENAWNDLDITDFVLKLLKPQQIEFLKSINYFGDYTITKDGMSFRTEVALATSQENESSFKSNGSINSVSCPRKLKSFIDGYSDGRSYCMKSNKILDTIKKEINVTCQCRIEEVESLPEYQKNDTRLTIVKRCYLNIQLICN